jgi:hypothetical protein
LMMMIWQLKKRIASQASTSGDPACRSPLTPPVQTVYPVLTEMKPMS